MYITVLTLIRVTNSHTFATLHTFTHATPLVASRMLFSEMVHKVGNPALTNIV